MTSGSDGAHAAQGPGTGSREPDEVRGTFVSACRVDGLAERVPVGRFTTFRVGGPADWFVEARRADQVLRALAAAAAAGVPVTVLGGGSNVLVGDRGIRGLVIRVRGGTIRRAGPEAVRADAGVTINGLVRWTITHGLGGIERWAGTPGTVGGAVHGNAHFDRFLLGDLVRRAALADRRGRVRVCAAGELEFAGDRSRLRRTGEVLLWAEFAVEPAEPARLRATARRSLAFRKRTQPLHAPSAGCVFRNPDPARDRLPAGIPASAGALIERAGLKGRTIGHARVSPIHGNFIINDGGATAAEIRDLIALCKQVVAERCGIELGEELVYLGEF